MSKMSNKTKKRQEPEEPELDTFIYSETEFAQQCKMKKKAGRAKRKSEWHLGIWLFGSILVVVMILLVCFTPIERLVYSHDLSFSFGKKVEAKAVDCELGVERPELLPLTASEIKREEEKVKAADETMAAKIKADFEAEKVKFREKHNGNDVHTRIICDNHRHRHTKCEYCGIRMKNDLEYASYYEGPKLERHLARDGKSWELREKK